MSQFVLNKRLKADTHFMLELETCSLRLLDDARWPWLVLVPRITGIEEWHDLTKSQRTMVDDEIMRVGVALKQMTKCEKLNIANISNIVRQMHIHVIARNKDDANWPGPVWGYGQRQPYEVDSAASFIESFKSKFS